MNKSIELYEREAILLQNILSQIQWKAGSSEQMIICECLLKKLVKEFPVEKPKEELKVIEK